MTYRRTQIRGTFRWLFALTASISSVVAFGTDLQAAGSSSGQLHAESALVTPSAIELSGAVVGSVRVNAGNIFDLENPEENKALFRVANKLHVITRGEVINQQLLFSPGDAFSVQSMEESERILRSNRYLQDAFVRPVAVNNGVVDVEVTTTDVWTLVPKLSLSRSGGENKGSIGI